MPTKTPAQRNPTEFEVHAEAYTRLKEAFPWYEVRADLKLTRQRKQRGARPDISVWLGDNLLAIGVVKRSAKGKWATTRAKAYEDFSVPVVTIRGIEDATNAPELFREAIRTHALSAPKHPTSGGGL